MLHVLVAYDNDDPKRGEYFDASQDNFISKVGKANAINLKLLDTSKCLEYPIDTYTSECGGGAFIFVAYLHGNEDALLVSDRSYVNCPNAYLFRDTLFFACSCLSAIELGQKLIQEGCKVFLGYNKKITTASNETEPIFYECENAFISHFITAENTIQDSLNFMYDKYLEMERHLAMNYGIFDAGILGQNLDAFEILLNENRYALLTKNDFILE